jgi:hypothetical protein
MINRDEVLNFSMKIEDIMYQKDVSPIDAVLIFCEETGFEIEMAAKLISSSLKSKIKIEAEDLHFLPKSNTVKLPL